MDNDNNRDQQDKSKQPKFNYYWIYGVILLVILGVQLMSLNSGVKDMDWSEFQSTVQQKDVEKLLILNKQTAFITIKKDKLSKEKYKEVADTPLGYPNKGPHFKYNIGEVEVFVNRLDLMQKDLPEAEKIYPAYDTQHNWLGEALGWILPILIIVAIWIFIMRRVGAGGAGPGGQIFNIGKSKATLFDRDQKVTVTFKDVAGLDEAKEEVMEVVDFLKHPKKYTALGGKIPKGVLLVGPPGTGKTLLAKAVAGEAGAPFFSISGSDFVEMFVGVGASRVRDLFKQAREKAPCIIFIDEIDAIGRARGRNSLQGNDERENTLNQLLVEMDGFSTEKGVILMAATNRPDVLDQALLRPGRFDRQIGIDKPDLRGRVEIFRVHLEPLKTGPDIDAEVLAEQTPGFAGADIANVCNEAALVAARRDKPAIEMEDFNYALDRVIGGLEKKNKLISPKEKKIIAYHEAGHAVSGWFLKHAHPLVKVTIVPRGLAALGYAQYLPKEQYLYRTEQLVDEMCSILGGRAAEEIIFGKITTGALSDLERVTKMAYAMVSIYGMNTSVGQVSFYDKQDGYQFNKPYSDTTANMIDKEVRDLIEGQYVRAKELLNKHRNELEILANELLEKEVLLKSDVERLIGKRPFGEDETDVTIKPSENGIGI